MNPELMTEKLQNILMKAVSICKENNNPELASEHLLATFLADDDIQSLLNAFHTNVNQLVEINNKYLGRLTSSDSNSDPMLNRYLSESYNEALKKSKQRNDKYISVFDMFIATLFNQSDVCVELRKYCAFTRNDIEDKVSIERGGDMINNKEDENKNIYWGKGKDEFVITYVYGKDVEVETFEEEVKA